MLISVNVSVSVEKPGMRHILSAFFGVLKPLLQEITTQVVLAFGKKYMEDGTLKRWYGKCTWKSSTGDRTTYICTPWGHIDIPQLQIRLADGKKTYITRRLLGVERRKHVPQITRRIMAALSALSTYRVAVVAGRLFTGFQSCLMAFQRAAVRVGSSIKPAILPHEQPILETDGTGVPVKHSTKRGEELKVLAQRQHDGGIRIAGIEVGRYCGDWTGFLKPIKSVFDQAMLVSDGDYDICHAAYNLDLHHQSCTWHVIHSIKYCLWKDGQKSKSPTVSSVITRVSRMIKSRHFKTDQQFRQSVRRIIADLRAKRLYRTAEYISRIGDDLNTAAQVGIYNSTTSLTERVMNTLNKRINVGVWSRRGVEAVSRLRAAIYYNGWRP